MQLFIHRVLEEAGLADHHFHDEGWVVFLVLLQVVHGRLQQYHKLVLPLIVLLLLGLATITIFSVIVAAI